MAVLLPVAPAAASGAGALAVTAHATDFVRHVALRRSVPADGDTLIAMPREVRLEFTQAPVLAMTTAVLRGHDGVALQTGEIRQGDDARVVVVPIPDVLGRDFALEWRTVARDGHVASGTIRFHVDRPAELEPDTAGGVAAEPLPEARIVAPAAAPVAWLEATAFPRSATRWVMFVAMLGVIGTAVFRFLILHPLSRAGADPLFLRGVLPRAATTGFVFALFLLATAGVRFYFQSLALAPGAPLGELLRTGWGMAWLYEVAWVAIAVGAFAIARRGSEAGWAVAAAAAVALAFAPGLAGHAAASPRFVGLAVVTDAAHVFGAGAWLGTLLLIMSAGLRSTAALEPTTRNRTVAAMIHRFSPAALAFAGLVVASGLVSTWLRAGSLRALWFSGYGSVLGWKLVLFVFVLLFGMYNWRKVRPKLGTGDVATERLSRTTTFELGSAAAVLALTAVLVATPPPTTQLARDSPLAPEEVPQHEGDGGDAGD